MTRRFCLAFGLALALGLVAPRSAVIASLPAHLTDQEFWKIASDASEPNGYFRSDTLTSNELWFQHVIPDLVRRTRPGGVYLGVGPEQNYTYIAAVRPAIAIIFDIRRGNMLLQLMYKALFELAGDRAEFVSRLFSRKRAAQVTEASTAAQLFAAYANVRSSQTLYDQNLKAIDRQLVTTHGFGLSDNDLRGIEFVYSNFFTFGPDNKADQRRIQLGQSTSTVAAVISGLSLGDKVIVEGLQRVRPGQPVSPGPASPLIQSSMKAAAGDGRAQIDSGGADGAKPASNSK